MSEYTNIKSNIDKCTAREKYLIDIIEKQREMLSVVRYRMGEATVTMQQIDTVLALTEEEEDD